MEGSADTGSIARGVLAVVTVLLATWASVHAVIYKRDPRAALLWVGVAWLMPLLGPLLYSVLGVNRIRRWAESLRRGMERYRSDAGTAVCTPDELERELPPEAAHLAGLARAVDAAVDRPLLRGNRVVPLRDGDEAYPAMWESIASAQRSVALSSYIFDLDEVGERFARLLGDAGRRGVQVRVLVDAAGARYSWPPIYGLLRREGVPQARFLPILPDWRLVTMNLRNHRKLLVVDGKVGFTGGMNLRLGHWRSRQPRRPVRDLHFQVEGPVVAHLQEAFVGDWQFTTGEALRGDSWFPPLEAKGTVAARGVADGPDEDYGKLRWTLLAALAAARTSIRIVTPYFLPDAALVAALNVAILRGVEVEILLPDRSNLPFVHEASRAMWWQILERGCRLWLSPPPFDHSKLLLVDAAWAFVGSANWDPRSLRLNFEFNLECYDPTMGEQLGAWIAERQANAREVTLAEADGREFGQRLWDGTARLLTPFL